MALIIEFYIGTNFRAAFHYGVAGGEESCII